MACTSELTEFVVIKDVSAEIVFHRVEKVHPESQTGLAPESTARSE